ncbi:MAG: helix-turn-helix domain-containing protein [Spirochaetaceae bacterium]|jgi:transcriptional regulator with XRE-family HTH domain|nr:helix-turn-helix domain-containing protein [Spirochaetaceae bacterium]
MDEAGLRSIFSLNIKRFRRRKGLSQEKLAEKMGISTNYLSDIETGKGWVSPFSLVKMANALEIEVFELFKPLEAVPEGTADLINKYLDDFSLSLRASFEKSIEQSLRETKKSR